MRSEISGHHARGIDHEVAKQLPQKLPGAVVCRHQRAQPLAQILDAAHGFHRGERRLLRQAILQRLAVQRPDFLVRAFADAFVEALAALFAEPAALHHVLHDFGNAIQLARRVERRRLI